MTTTKFRPRVTARRTRLEGARRRAGRAEYYDLVIERMTSFGNSQREIPRRVTLLRPDPGKPSADQLFLDKLPMPRDAWSYDPHDRTLTWRGAFGGGHMYLSHDGLGGYGNIGPADDVCSVTAGARAQFSCDVALDCGATYVSSGNTVPGFLWDTASPAWTGANWVANRLLLTYTYTPGTGMDPPSFTFEFQDNQTGALPWDPDTFQAVLTLVEDEHTHELFWSLTFKYLGFPPADRGPHAPTGPDTVYPLWLQAVEDPAATTINGVMEIDQPAPSGKLAGISGVQATPLAAGYYQASAQAAPFGVFDGRLVIGGAPVPGSAVTGDRLRWTGLSAAHQVRTGLPEQGSLVFSADGSGAVSEDATVRVRRLGATAALAAISRHSDLHPDVHRRAGELHEALADATPDFHDLLLMTPFGQNQQNAWGDVVQANVTTDLFDITNSSVAADLWNLVFPSTPQQALSGVLAEVASSPVTGVTDPKQWYQSLGTAVMTQGLAGGSDPNCKYLNGPRAAAWLKTEVAASKVYYRHGQLLFTHEWQQHCPLTEQFLQDQAASTASRAGEIDNTVSAAVNDINQNVVVNEDSDKDLKANLIADVRNAGDYAKTNNLYWAFRYYYYNTTPALLANIALQMSADTGSPDGTLLARLFQTNVAVLTALDSSGYFAQRYTSTINTFLATNILPSMFGFADDPATFDLLKVYLQTFRDQNLANEDADIAGVAAQLASIMAEQDFDQTLHDWIDALRSISGAIEDALALPLVATEFSDWFSTTYPKFAKVADVMGSLVIGGLTGFAVFNLFSEWKSLDELSPAEIGSLVTNTIQLSLQIVAAVVKRGIRIGSIYSVQGMTTAQRAAAISKILVTGEADILDESLVRIGNAAARWLGDTQGTIGALEEGEVTSLLFTEQFAAVADASLVSKVLGRNLDEFIATRVGPVFILAGIGFSIYTIATGESGIELASDILNIVSGSLMLFSIVGAWLVQAEVVVAGSVMASIFSIAGPLAILVALAGVGLMLYQLYKKPPDPVEQFVDDYAKPAGFWVSDAQSGFDYAAVTYINPDQRDLFMVGFTLAAEGQVLHAEPDRSVRSGTATAQPSCVWQSATDGSGMSKLFTIIQPDATKPPVAAFLSLMSDKETVSFQPAIPSTPSKPGDTPVDAHTQTWRATVQGNAALTSDGKHMAGMSVTFEAMDPPTDGTYPPVKSLGWLALTGTGTVDILPDAAEATPFRLTMSGMAPNYIQMASPSFPLNSTPSQAQAYGPAFGIMPSTPLTYELSGDPLPAFLTFDDKLGVITPNGQPADTPLTTKNAITVTNDLDEEEAQFTITVAAPTS